MGEREKAMVVFLPCESQQVTMSLGGGGRVVVNEMGVMWMALRRCSKRPTDKVNKRRTKAVPDARLRNCSICKAFAGRGGEEEEEGPPGVFHSPSQTCARAPFLPSFLLLLTAFLSPEHSAPGG